MRQKVSLGLSEFCECTARVKLELTDFSDSHISFEILRMGRKVKIPSKIKSPLLPLESGICRP